MNDDLAKQQKLREIDNRIRNAEVMINTLESDINHARRETEELNLKKRRNKKEAIRLRVAEEELEAKGKKVLNKILSWEDEIRTSKKRLEEFMAEKRKIKSGN